MKMSARMKLSAKEESPAVCETAGPHTGLRDGVVSYKGGYFSRMKSQFPDPATNRLMDTSFHPCFRRDCISSEE